MGQLPEKGGTGMCGPQEPLFTPLLPFTRLPVEAQDRSQDSHLKEKCDILPPISNIFRKYGNFLLQMLIWLRLSSKSFKIWYNVSFQAPVLIHSQFHSNLSVLKPPSSAAHTYLLGEKLSVLLLPSSFPPPTVASIRSPLNCVHSEEYLSKSVLTCC